MTNGTQTKAQQYAAMAAKYEAMADEARKAGNATQAHYWTNEAAAYRIAAEDC